MRRERLFAGLFLSLVLVSCDPCYAYTLQKPSPYERLLVRSAHAYWGLDAPIATLAAQVHAESSWQSKAVSAAGAQGLAQFMPATTRWFSQIYPKELGEADPTDPAWAMRALVLYTRWLHHRVKGADACERMAFVLAAYNGGLGWVRRDQLLAIQRGASPVHYFGHAELFNAGRSAPAFSENRNYVERIMFVLEPKYCRLGGGVCSC